MRFLIFFFALIVVNIFGFSESRYYPRPYVVGGSFYSNPRYSRDYSGYRYLPPQMTAMVVGDTVATNSFSGSSLVPSQKNSGSWRRQADQNQYYETVTEKRNEIFAQEPEVINETEPELVSSEPSSSKGGEQETLFSIEDATTELIATTTKLIPVVTNRVPTSASTRQPKVRKSKTTTAAPASEEVEYNDEDEDDEEDLLPGTWPFAAAAGRKNAKVPAYNAFFPIFIGQSGRSKSRNAEDYPGSATAIANAFSTGKGGVATSHATAFGDPYAAGMFRNAGLFNGKRKAHLPIEKDN